MQPTNKAASSSRSGHAVVEIALISPWIFLLFIGIFDVGFYYYAAISTANAARVAAMYTAGTSTLDDSHSACTAAIEEMRELPNIKSGVNCPGVCAAGSACTAGPLKVTANSIDQGPDGGPPATQVTVQYQTVNLIPIPGLAGSFTLKRTVQMRQRL